MFDNAEIGNRGQPYYRAIPPRNWRHCRPKPLNYKE
jgi:hypothetical protein